MTTPQPAALPELPEGVTLEDLLIPLRAALSTCHDTDWSLRQFKTHITHALAALQPAAVSAEREACARLCDARSVKFHSESPFAAECHGLAEAIRARGDSAQQATPEPGLLKTFLAEADRAGVTHLPATFATDLAAATPEPVGAPTEGEFFAWDAEGGIAFYKARQEAINHAKESLRYYRDGANDHGEWDEDVEHIRWGVVMQRAEATNISATEDGESSCDYELQDVATHPAPGVPDGEPKLTQEELLEVAKHAWLMARTADSLQFYRTLLSAAAQAKGGDHG